MFSRRRTLLRDLAISRKHAAALAVLLMTMNEYAAAILRQAREGRALADDDVIRIGDRMRDRYLKNLSSAGLPIEDEAEAFRQALANFDELRRGLLVAAEHRDER